MIYLSQRWLSGVYAGAGADVWQQGVKWWCTYIDTPSSKLICRERGEEEEFIPFKHSDSDISILMIAT